MVIYKNAEMTVMSCQIAEFFHGRYNESGGFPKGTSEGRSRTVKTPEIEEATLQEGGRSLEL